MTARLHLTTITYRYLGTGFSADCLSALRKLMGARTIQDESWLSGEDAYMCYATSAAEGDNTIMELKIVQVGERESYYLY